MERALSFMVGLLGLLLVVSTFQLLLSLGVIESPPPAPVRWEYKVESVDDIGFEQKAGEIGAEGWEIVAARRATGSDKDYKYEFVFKRPVK